MFVSEPATSAHWSLTPHPKRGEYRGCGVGLLFCCPGCGMNNYVHKRLLDESNTTTEEVACKTCGWSDRIRFKERAR